MWFSCAARRRETKKDARHIESKKLTLTRLWDAQAVRIGRWFERLYVHSTHGQIVGTREITQVGLGEQGRGCVQATADSILCRKMCTKSSTGSKCQEVCTKTRGSRKICLIHANLFLLATISIRQKYRVYRMSCTTERYCYSHLVFPAVSGSTTMIFVAELTAECHW